MEVFLDLRATYLQSSGGKAAVCVKTLLKKYELLLKPCNMLPSRKVKMWPFIPFEQIYIQCFSPVSQCPCYCSSLVQNLVWWKLHIVRLCIPLAEGDLRDLLWHSICAPKHEIQLHLAGRSTGTVWGNLISRTGTSHPQSHLFTSELCQQNGRLSPTK